MTLADLARLRLIRRKIKEYGVKETRNLLRPTGWWDNDCKMWAAFQAYMGERTTCDGLTVRSVTNHTSLKRSGRYNAWLATKKRRG